MLKRFTQSPDLNNAFTSGTLRVLLGLGVLIAVLGFIYLGQNGQATLTGRRTQELQERLSRLRRENAQLEAEIAQYRNPKRLADRATALGMHPATISETLYLVVKNYPVESRTAAQVAPSPQSSSSSDLASLWNQLVALFGLTPAARTAEAKGP
jgi:cell division protein FtsB